METRATLTVVLCAAIAGIAGILIKSMPTFTPTGMAGLRMSLPSLILGFYIKSQGINIFRKNWSRMLGASALNAFRLYFFFVAYIYTSVGAAAVMFYCYPVFVALMGHFFLKERMNKVQWSFLLVALLGIVVAYSHQPLSFENEDFIGMSAGLVSGFIYAITVVIFKSQSENYNSNEMLFFQNIVGGIVYLPFFIFIIPDVTLHDTGICLLYTFITGFVVFKLFFMGLKHLDASIVSSIMYLEIVSAIVLSYLILGERLSPNMVIGGAIIILSSFMINKEGRSRNKNKSN